MKGLIIGKLTKLELHSHTLACTWSKVNNILACWNFSVDVTEIQVAGMGIFMVSGIFGVQVWSQQVGLLLQF